MSIEELRRMYDEICDHYTGTKNRILTFLAGALGLLGFLYGGGDLFIPEQIYGKVFYWIGLGSYIVATGLLIVAVQPILWHMPTDFKEHKKTRYSTLLDFQEYVIDEYINSISQNQIGDEKKKKLLTIAFALLTLGAIVLVVLKNFK